MKNNQKIPVSILADREVFEYLKEKGDERKTRTEAYCDLLDKSLAGFVSPFLRKKAYVLQPNQCHLTVSDLINFSLSSMLTISEKRYAEFAFATTPPSCPIQTSYFPSLSSSVYHPITLPFFFSERSKLPITFSGTSFDFTMRICSISFLHIFVPKNFISSHQSTPAPPCCKSK